MKALIFTAFILVSVAQASRDWSKIKPKRLSVVPRIPAPAPKIVGGKEAEPHSIAFQVAVLEGFNFCGGSIIRDDAVLTAAHCVDKARSTEVIVGAHNIQEEEPTQQLIRSKAIRVHEDWDSFKVLNDIAIIFLSRKIALDQTARIVKLNKDKTTLVGVTAIVSGWGRFSDESSSLSNYLRYGEEEIISNQECKLYFGSYVTKTNVCLNGSNGVGSCTGDSGGPLVIVRNNETVQVGIVSFGVKGSCETGSPTVYTRITEYNDWIDKQLES
ncbi:hypothetical protein ILUMI_10545 [Ignelater luminosus]|uniref:Peptidase S1 domain-containing protein n=1 Tax=Ignelater luminosus TaxID=2038154 RepID=A0A8K0G8K9_IGNLU|nr:hypothetical protein ILUMI_10545 [Ignelater luminosus]